MQGCDQAFSRKYTLNVHIKSHELFESYHDYKKEPMLFYDPDLITMREEMTVRVASRVRT